MNLRRPLLPLSLLLVAALSGCNPFTSGPPPKAIIKGIGTLTVFAGSDEAGFADGMGKEARFHDLRDISVDAQGNVYVSDGRNYVIRKITPRGEVSTLAGNRESGALDGKADEAGFTSPGALVASPDGVVYLADSDVIRRIATDGTTTTLAGSETSGYTIADGQGTAARFARIRDLALDSDGHLIVVDSTPDTSGPMELYVSGSESDHIRRVNDAGEVTTLFGEDLPEGNPGKEVALDALGAIAVEPDGTIVLAQGDGYLKGGFEFLSLDGKLTRRYESKEQFRSSPSAKDGIAIDGKGNYYFNNGGTFYRIDGEGETTMLIGRDNAGFADIGSVNGIAAAPDGSIYFVAPLDNRVYKISI